LKIKRYVANDMAQACDLIKEDLGSEALILSTQPVKSGGPLRRRSQIEVVAGISEPGDAGYSERHALAGAAAGPSIAQAALAHDIVRDTAEAAAAAVSLSDVGRKRLPRYRPGRRAEEHRERLVQEAAGDLVAQAQTEPDGSLERVEQTLAELRRSIDRLATPKGQAHLLSLSKPARELYERLQAQEMPAEMLEGVFETLRASLRATGLDDAAAIRNAAAETISSQLNETRALHLEPGQTTVAFFVGPTGSGKTTTAIKLGVRLQAAGSKVLLVNADIGRPGALAQLETYASALGIASDVVYSPSDLRAVIARASDFDAVLVDTAGASPENAAKLAEIQALIATVRRKEVYLVLNATAKLSDLRKAAERFHAAGLTGVAVTRRDETETLGPVAGLLAGIQVPLAAWGTGQDVLSDLRDADIRELADAVVGHERHDRINAARELALGA
jgi:flagellar biosynthesis protein FlhF